LWGCRTFIIFIIINGSALERAAIEGESPVCVTDCKMEGILSTAEPEKISSYKTGEEYTLYAKKLDEKGWKIGKFSSKGDSGYFGIGFINEEKKQIIVAHGSSKLSNELAQIASNSMDLLRGEKPKQYIEAELFVEDIVKEFGTFQISHTGCFSGAVLAELLAYYRREVAVTAESPGISSMIQKHYIEENLNGVHIVSYLSPPNMINTFDTHIGEQRTVNPITRFNQMNRILAKKGISGSK